MEPEFEGKRLVATRSAYRELEDLGLSLYDAAQVLDCGWNCSTSRRAEGKVERCLSWGEKVLRAVAAEGWYFPPLGEREEVWWLIHVSIESPKRR